MNLRPKMTLILIALLSASCAIPPQVRRAPSANPDGPRTIILNGNVFTKDGDSDFIAWRCVDFIDGGRTLTEFGYFTQPQLQGVGFVLYDGGYVGELTHYQRAGIDHRWDWGPNRSDFTFVISPDGTGLFYNFTNVSPGESIRPNRVFRCYQR